MKDYAVIRSSKKKLLTRCHQNHIGKKIIKEGVL